MFYSGCFSVFVSCLWFSAVDYYAIYMWFSSNLLYLGSLSFLKLYIYVLHQLWEMLSCYSFKYFFLPLSFFFFSVVYVISNCMSISIYCKIVPTLMRKSMITWLRWWQIISPFKSVCFCFAVLRYLWDTCDDSLFPKDVSPTVSRIHLRCLSESNLIGIHFPLLIAWAAVPLNQAG